MLEPSAYRLVPSRSDPAAYDVVDRETEQLVGVATEEKVVRSDPAGGVFGSLVRRSRLFSAVAMTVAILRACVSGVGILFGFRPHRSDGSRPRLIVRRFGDGAAVFSLQVSSGMMYESRRVDDGTGEPVARFRSPFKTNLRAMGFGVIDLRGAEKGLNDDSRLPWLGRVCRVGDDGFSVKFVGRGDVGRVIEHGSHAGPNAGETGERPTAGCWDVDSGPQLQGDATGKILLLAAALTVAWRPPQG